MRKDNKNKRSISYLHIIPLICLLLIIIPVKINAIRIHIPDEKAEEAETGLFIFSLPLDLIAPDQITPTVKMDKNDTRYMPCDQMPRLIGYAYSYITKHRPISSNPDAYGTVLVHTLINASGRVENCIVAKTIQDTCLVKILVEKIKTSTFYPATRHGKPVDVWVGIPVQFILKQKPIAIE